MNRAFSIDEQGLLAELIMRRRDVRGNNFLPDSIAQSEIDKILQAAVAAPSVGLSQPWDFVLVDDPEIKARLYDNFTLEHEAAKASFSKQKRTQYSALKLEGIKESPLNMAVFYKPPQQATIGNNTMPEMGEYSVVCAIQNMWLMARALNIGMGWVSIINPEVVKDLLHIPDEHRLIAYLCFGYVKTFYDAPELELLGWDTRKTLTSFVHYNGYQEGG